MKTYNMGVAMEVSILFSAEDATTLDCIVGLTVLVGLLSDGGVVPIPPKPSKENENELLFVAGLMVLANGEAALTVICVGGDACMPKPFGASSGFVAIGCIG